MIDILVALAFAGCIYGIARVWGRRPDYRRVAGYTAFGMFVIAAYTEFSIASAGTQAPSLGRLVPIMLFAVLMFRIGRKEDPELAPPTDMVSDATATGWRSHLRTLMEILGVEADQDAADEHDGRTLTEGV